MVRSAGPDTRSMADPPPTVRPTPAWQAFGIGVGFVAMVIGLAMLVSAGATRAGLFVRPPAPASQAAGVGRRDARLAAVLPPGADDVVELGPGWATYRLTVAGVAHRYVMRYAEVPGGVVVHALARAD